ncbi:MAG: hypothetical protein ACI8O8_002717 [Oleiphilaceae bacterium]|jgi:hypothetical protein
MTLIPLEILFKAFPFILFAKGLIMTSQMKTYVAVDQHGNTVHVSAYTESDARQQAEEELGSGNVVSFSEI